jgi:hypothetical protein
VRNVALEKDLKAAKSAVLSHMLELRLLIERLQGWQDVVKNVALRESLKTEKGQTLLHVLVQRLLVERFQVELHDKNIVAA